MGGQVFAFAAQALVFFLFTPLTLLARYGGRALELRKADAERRAAMREFGIDHVEWLPAGKMVLDDSGAPRMPDLPPVPGLRRLEFTGGLYAGSRSVSIIGSSNLQLLSRGQRPGWLFAEDDMQSHLRLGGEIRVSYVDAIQASHGPFDLADAMKRRRVVSFMRQEVEIEAARAA